MQIFLEKIMTALNAPFTRISQPHASGKKSHVTQTLLIPICRMLPQVNKAEMKVKNHNLSKTTKNAISLRMAMNIQWWTLLCSPANPNKFIILELLWVWEPTYKKISWSSGSSKRSLHGVFSRGMGGWSWAKGKQMQSWIWELIFCKKGITKGEDWLYTGETRLIYFLQKSHRCHN